MMTINELQAAYAEAVAERALPLLRRLRAVHLRATWLDLKPPSPVRDQYKVRVTANGQWVWVYIGGVYTGDPYDSVGRTIAASRDPKRALSDEAKMQETEALAFYRCDSNVGDTTDAPVLAGAINVALAELAGQVAAEERWLVGAEAAAKCTRAALVESVR